MDLSRFSSPDLRVGIVGLGYVGLPLLIAFHRSGVAVTGVDIDPEKIRKLNAGSSYLEHLPDQELASLAAAGTAQFSTSFEVLRECDAILIAVPTPLTEERTPDLQYVLKTGTAIGEVLQNGQLVVLESTTYPGTTREQLAPLLESTSGLRAGEDFLVAFSPEREDPGNPEYGTASIPKVVGGVTPGALEAAAAVYGHIVEVVRVSSAEIAEMTKLLENIYRSVNIALVNELKLLAHRMEIDIWEVIAAAETKPFGFQAFDPGPGLGGHCIPIDPFYLAWRAEQFGFTPRFIELAGEINTAMPDYVVSRLEEALEKRGKPLADAAVLILGLAYKRNVGDDRESPAYPIMDTLEKAGARTAYHDPHVPVVGVKRDFPQMTDRRSEALTSESIRSADAVVIITDHDDVDYALVGREASLIVDTRNVMARVKDVTAEIVQA